MNETVTQHVLDSSRLISNQPKTPKEFTSLNLILINGNRYTSMLYHRSLRLLINSASVRILRTHVCCTLGHTAGSHACHSRAVVANTSNPRCCLTSGERGSVVTGRWNMRFVFGTLSANGAWRIRPIVAHRCHATVEPASTALAPHLRVGVTHDRQYTAPLGMLRVRVITIEGQYIPGAFTVVVDPLDAATACVGGPAWVNIALASVCVAAIAVGEVSRTLAPCLEGGVGRWR